MSLSSRRAWIEMPKREQKLNLMSSRSPHGERGLKSERWLKGTRKLRRSPHGERGLKYEIIESGAMVQDASLSSRRAWIEIFVVLEHMNMFHIVALLTESVDWNIDSIEIYIKVISRSPHGERGLKSNGRMRLFIQFCRRSPHGERGLKYGATAEQESTPIVALLTESVDWN